MVAEKDAGAVDCGEVRGVETADEHGFDFASVEFEKHAVDAVLDYTCAEIGVATHAVCAAAMCRCILEHYGAVAVIGVGEGECVGRQHVKERFFCRQIGFDCLMVVEVVASQVGEYASCVVKTGYAVLVGCMAAHLHCRECASAVDHFGQQGVQLKRAGSGVVGFDFAFVDFVDYGG